MKRIFLIGVLLAGPVTAGLFAQHNPAADSPELAKLTVVVTGEASEPVADAEVKPHLLGTKESRGYRLWDDRTHGPPPVAVSNRDGVAVLEYPSQVQLRTQRQSIARLIFQVRHAEFAQKDVEFNLGPSAAKVRLEHGCEVRITAVNETTRQPLQDFGVMMAGPEPAELWVDTEDGGRRTRAIPEGTWQTIVVKPQADGSTLFSEVLPIRATRQRAMVLRNVWLSPGAVLRGTLSKNVPRPVSGYVIAESVPSPAADRDDRENPSLVWYDWVEIAEDGRFEFASLPRGGAVHLLAFCDGWLAQTDQDLEGANFCKMGQLFVLDDQTVHVTLKMERTGTLEVKALAPDGTPLTEGQIASWPNHRFYKGGIEVLGRHRSRSIDTIKNQFLPPGKRREQVDHDLELPFQQRVNPDGVTVLTGLPLNYSFGVFLYHDRFRLAGTKRRSEGVVLRLQSPEPAQLTLKTMIATPEKENDEQLVP